MLFSKLLDSLITRQSAARQYDRLS